MPDCLSLKRDLRKSADKKKSAAMVRFFKTGPGEYGEGDVFLGISNPVIKKVAVKYRDLSFSDIERLLRSKIHEERLTALQIMILRFSSPAEKRRVYDLYLENTRYINNWDLVDISAYKIVGAYLSGRPKAPLYKMARSKNLWDRRIAMISTFYFIKNNQFKDTLKIAGMLLQDRHDLMHKAVGWMLREVGKRDMPAEETFLKENCSNMPRTALRYAIERFPEKKRKRYLFCAFDKPVVK